MSHNNAYNIFLRKDIDKRFSESESTINFASGNGQFRNITNFKEITIFSEAFHLKYKDISSIMRSRHYFYGVFYNNVALSCLCAKFHRLISRVKPLSVYRRTDSRGDTTVSVRI